jgi:hypothetical protein
MLQRQIDAADRQLARLVHNLYGLTAELLPRFGLPSRTQTHLLLWHASLRETNIIASS